MRKIVLIVFAVLLSIMSPVSTFAASEEQTLESTSKVYEPSGNLNAKVTFIDKNLLGSSISPQAGERRVYKYSYYQVASQQITAYNVGPREKDKFLISVSKGVTKTITGTISIAASVTYSASVSADIAKVVNASLTGEVSGSMSYEWSKSTAYSGPTGNFTTRDYYGAINYDKYNNVVKKYDVYDLYLGSVHEGTSTELSSTINVNAVKKPKVVEYYRDHNN